MTDRTIPLDTLEAVRTIIVHRYAGKNCPDGMAAMILLNDALPGRELIFVTHEDIKTLEPHSGMLFCDIAPPRDHARRFVDAGAIVLDHHDKQKDVVDLFGDRGIYHETESGAWLAFEKVWYPFRVNYNTTMRSRAEDFATFASIRDTFKRTHPLWLIACAQAEALGFYPWHGYIGSIRDPFGDGWPRMESMLHIGDVLLTKRAEHVALMKDAAYRYTTAKGTNVAIVPTYETSDVADAMRDCDLVVGFSFFSKESSERKEQGFRGKMTLSLRTGSGTYDVGEMAKHYKGGGHKESAGFSVEVLDTDPEPWGRIMRLIAMYESPISF